MQHLPLFWVKFDLTQLVLKTLSQSADAIDKNDRSNTDGMPPANTQPRKPNNSLFNGSTLWWGLWCIGQSSAHTPQRSSPFPPSTTFIRPEIQQCGWSRDKDGGMRERKKGGRMEKVNEREGERSETTSFVRENPYATGTGMCCPFSLTLSVRTFCVTKTSSLGGHQFWTHPQLFSLRTKGVLCNIQPQLPSEKWLRLERRSRLWYRPPAAPSYGKVLFHWLVLIKNTFSTCRGSFDRGWDS